jgi:deoxyribodipyrimidine photolyase
MSSGKRLLPATSAATSLSQSVIWWVRPTNIRLHDNQVLVAACAAAAAAPRPGGVVHPVFVFDSDSLTQRSRTAHVPRASLIRIRFLIEAVADLRTQLREKHGVHLIVRVGSPVKLLKQVWLVLTQADQHHLITVIVVTTNHQHRHRHHRHHFFIVIVIIAC